MIYYDELLIIKKKIDYLCENNNKLNSEDLEGFFDKNEIIYIVENYIVITKEFVKFKFFLPYYEELKIRFYIDKSKNIHMIINHVNESLTINIKNLKNYYLYKQAGIYEKSKDIYCFKMIKKIKDPENKYFTERYPIYRDIYIRLKQKKLLKKYEKYGVCYEMDLRNIIQNKWDRRKLERVSKTNVKIKRNRL